MESCLGLVGLSWEESISTRRRMSWAMLGLPFRYRCITERTKTTKLPFEHRLGSTVKDLSNVSLTFSHS